MHPSMYYKIDLEQSGLDLFNYNNIPELNEFGSNCVNYQDIYGK